MNQRIISLTITCLFISLLAVQAQQRSQPPTKEPSAGKKTQIHDGLEITVLSIQRTKEREVMPHFPQKMRAESGYEFAVLTLKVKPLESEKKLDVSLLQLSDVNGSSYKCLFKETDLCDGTPGNETTCDLPFAVPEGIQLSKLQIGEVSFDLKNLEKK
jgi:hypothetical protein